MLDEYQFSIASIWNTGGPAIGAGILRACRECYRPIEAATGEWVLCQPCWRERMREVRDQPCDACGQPCWATRCKACSVVPKVSRVYFPVCIGCGQRFTSKRAGRKCCSPACQVESNRVRIRNQYRARMGIPLDAPIRGRVS